MRRLLFLLLLLLPAFALNAQAQQAPQQPNYKKKGAAIPPFLIKRMDGSTVSNAQLKAGVPTVFFIFSPTCDHCEKVIDTLKAREAEFKNAQFVFVAEERQRSHMKAFLSRAALPKSPLFRNIGTDQSNLIYFLYEYQVLPQMNVYNSRGRLAHTFTTTTPLDSMKLFLK